VQEDLVAGSRTERRGGVQVDEAGVQRRCALGESGAGAKGAR
jgi:hypothetical protein